MASGAIVNGSPASVAAIAIDAVRSRMGRILGWQRGCRTTGNTTTWDGMTRRLLRRSTARYSAVQSWRRKNNLEVRTPGAGGLARRARRTFPLGSGLGVFLDSRLIARRGERSTGGAVLSERERLQTHYSGGSGRAITIVRRYTHVRRRFTELERIVSRGGEPGRSRLCYGIPRCSGNSSLILTQVRSHGRMVTTLIDRLRMLAIEQHPDDLDAVPVPLQ